MPHRGQAVALPDPPTASACPQAPSLCLQCLELGVQPADISSQGCQCGRFSVESVNFRFHMGQVRVRRLKALLQHGHGLSSRLQFMLHPLLQTCPLLFQPGVFLGDSQREVRFAFSQLVVDRSRLVHPVVPPTQALQLLHAQFYGLPRRDDDLAAIDPLPVGLRLVPMLFQLRVMRADSCCSSLRAILLARRPSTRTRTAWTSACFAFSWPSQEGQLLRDCLLLVLQSWFAGKLLLDVL